MRVTHEDPGRRLELEESDSRLLPIAIGLALTALVAAPWRALWALMAHGTSLASADLVPTAIFGAGGLLLVFVNFGGGRLERLSVDRTSGRLEWSRSHVLGLVRWSGAQPLASVESLALSLASPPRSWGSNLRIAFRHGPASRERRFEVSLAGVDSVEKVAAFALRIGAAAGQPWHRVTLHERARFAVELAASSRPGYERLPPAASEGGTAALADAAAAAVAGERLPPFDPATFRGDARVSVWAPGREVRIDKGWGPWMLLSPLVLAAGLGPLSYFRLPSLHAAPLLPRVVALVMITLVGLMLALVGWTGFTMGQPRHVRIDWASRELRVETPRHRRVVPLAHVAGVELRHKSYTTGRAQHGMVRTGYWSEVRVSLRGPSDPPDELLIVTRSFQDAPAPPREMVLPIGRELGAALSVAVTESGPA